MYQQIHQLLVKMGLDHPAHHERFFKTQPGFYAAHDKFLGVNNVPLRHVANTYQNLDFDTLSKLMLSAYNEERLLALYILIEQQKEGNKEAIKAFYLEHIHGVNNWNLVDASAHQILGESLYHQQNYNLLYDYAKHDNLWLRRIGMVATLYPIKQHEFRPTIDIAQILLSDKEDLIHKASGWMLRELGKRNAQELDNFLKAHGKLMPRTMLRYAIERLEQKQRLYWLQSTKT